jgi:hypothetical protein
MRQPKLPGPLLLALIVGPALFVGDPALAGGEETASKSLTIQPTGARSGKPGEFYFNVEGKRNGDGGKYASFSVLAFPSKGFEGGDLKAGGLTLTLVQSIAGFSKDGGVKFFLATGEFDAGALKFDPVGTDGLAAEIGSRQPLGSGEFKKGKTGKADTFALALDDEARKVLSDRIAQGKEVFVLVVPDDDDVAATYFGAGQEDAMKRPRLKITPAP